MNQFAVIFDMDGVIVDNYNFHNEAWKQFCKIHEIPFDKVFRSGIFGGTNKDHLEVFFGRKLTSNEISKFEQQKEKIYRTLYRPFIRPVEGVVELLKLLSKNKIPIALATSSPPVNVNFVLSYTGTKKFFQHILNASDIINGKPNPEIFFKAADKLGFEYQRCIVIEDSLSGIAAAQNAGMKTIAITTTHRREELLKVDMVISDFKNLGIYELKNLVILNSN